MAKVDGVCAPKFQQVRDLLNSRLELGEELGASICVNIDGKDVVDLWGGHADPGKTRPWTQDTVTVVWSCSKVVTALAAALLVDRGLLDPDEKMSKYWPEFGANGKENVTVGQVLSHTSGLPAWEQPITAEEIYDTAKATERLAKQAPWWTPGGQSGYQLFTHGHLVGEIVRRISGTPLKQFIADEIATPLQADFRLGLEEKDWPRAADIIPPPTIPLDALDPESFLARAIVGSPVPAEAAMGAGFRAAELGAVNGFGNARSLCRIGSILSLGGTVDGRKYLSPSTIDKILEERISGQDVILPLFLRFGLGVGLPPMEIVPWIPEGRVCFWGGWGGSILIMDLDRRMTITYVMNKMAMATLGNENTALYVRAIYDALSK